MSFPPGFENMCSKMDMHFLSPCTARLPCKTKPCTAFCLEGTRDCDEWVTHSHAANQALGVTAGIIKDLIEHPELLAVNNLTTIPPTARRDLGRLAYDAHFFTMPKDVDLKTLWKDWHEDEEYLPGSFARLDLQEFVKKSMETAVDLDFLLQQRCMTRKHATECPCKTTLGSRRFEYYTTKVVAECQDNMTVLEAKPGTLSRDDIVEYARLRYNVMRLNKSLMDDETLQKVWQYGHEIKTLSGSALREASDHLRKEIKEDRSTLSPNPTLLMLGGESKFKCPYIHEEWSNVHQPSTTA